MRLSKGVPPGPMIVPLHSASSTSSPSARPYDTWGRVQRQRCGARGGVWMAHGRQREPGGGARCQVCLFSSRCARATPFSRRGVGKGARAIQRACAWQALAAQGRAGRPHGWRGARRTRARGTADTFLPGAHAPQGRRALCSPRLPACRPARTHAPCHRQCRAPLVPTPPSGGRSAAPRRQPSRQRYSRAVWLQEWPSGKKHRKRKDMKGKKDGQPHEARSRPGGWCWRAARAVHAPSWPGRSPAAWCRPRWWLWWWSDPGAHGRRDDHQPYGQ